MGKLNTGDLCWLHIKKKGRDGSFKGLKKEWWVYCVKLSTFLLFKYSLEENYGEQGKLWHLLLWRSVLD
jgi:hypothetical protein